MAQDAENAQSRLSNIEAVVPILGALRTISLGNWQGALNRRAGLRTYTQGLLRLIPAVLRSLPSSKPTGISGLLRRKPQRSPLSKTSVGIVYAFGTERGLCGRYNRVLAESVMEHLTTLHNDSVSLKVRGARLERALSSLDDAPAIAEFIPSSLTGMPTYPNAAQYVREWLVAYERGELDFVDLIYNASSGTGQYAPRVLRLLPPDLSEAGLDNTRDEVDDAWIIIDTDPLALLVRIIEQWTSITLYQVMLDAVATEHSARYQLMESASKNADDLVEDLTLSIQSLRRQAITREMQELAVGAGMVG